MKVFEETRANCLFVFVVAYTIHEILCLWSLTAAESKLIDSWFLVLYPPPVSHVCFFLDRVRLAENPSQQQALRRAPCRRHSQTQEGPVSLLSPQPRCGVLSGKSHGNINNSFSIELIFTYSSPKLFWACSKRFGLEAVNWNFTIVILCVW